MKTITLDYDLYTKELEASRKQGIDSGIFMATSYISDPNSYMMRRDEYYSKCKALDEAVQQRNEQACNAYLDELIGEKKLFVPVMLADGCHHMDVISHCQNGDAIQLNLEE